VQQHYAVYNGRVLKFSVDQARLISPLLYAVFGRPFVKRFALCYRSCDVPALWPNGWTDQDETWHAGRPRPWPHCVRWRRQLSSSWYRYSYAASGILHYCGQMAGWMKTPLGTEADIGAGHIVLDGFPALRERGTAPPPSFRPMSIVATVAHLRYC